VIIETKLEFDSFLEKYQDSSCILIPILCDVNKHPLENSLCLIYVELLDGGEYLLPFKINTLKSFPHESFINS